MFIILIQKVYILKKENLNSLEAVDTPDIFTSSGSLKTASQIQTIINANKKAYGVDCSGFAYYVLNEASGGKVKNNLTMHHMLMVFQLQT